MKTNRKNQTRIDKAALRFLPAVLEIEETPPSPLSRMVLWLMIAFVTLFILWAAIGRVDVVAVARGKVVRHGEGLVLTAQVKNKDIGFIRMGQDAEIKIDTFPFEKYGVIHARITQIADDAVPDSRGDLVFNAILKMEKEHVVVKNTRVGLKAGMAATAELKLGQRKIIEYFISPLLRYRDESIRER
jgi:hemolysin D